MAASLARRSGNDIFAAFLPVQVFCHDLPHKDFLDVAQTKIPWYQIDLTVLLLVFADQQAQNNRDRLLEPMQQLVKLPYKCFRYAG